VSGQIPPGCRVPAPAGQDLGEEEQAAGAGTSCAAVEAAVVVATAVMAAAVAEGQERRQGAAGAGPLTVAGGCQHLHWGLVQGVAG
jgi:hypothetical protein